ncbi:Development/cell death domain containing protein [Salix suchowensis]|nr:Development/cell death domain containing protein [Salix suchowensis]
MHINTAYAYNSGSSLATMLHPVFAPTATHVMMEGTKRLYGIYSAVSRGGMNLEPAAFNGKFPAQVRFKIVNDCLPLAESALKHAIKDNYQGSKFRQELNTEQVKTLVSLFRPIDLPPFISGVPTFANVAPAHAFPSAITVEKVLPSARPYSLYLPGATHAHTLSGGWPQPSKHLHYVHQNTLPQSNQNYSAEAPKSTYDHQSYQMAMEMGLRNHVARHENQYHVPQFPKEREAVLHSANFANYYHSQYLPSATTLHISSQAQGLAPSYAFPASSGAKQPLRSTYQSHYTINL